MLDNLLANGTLYFIATVFSVKTSIPMCFFIGPQMGLYWRSMQTCYNFAQNGYEK